MTTLFSRLAVTCALLAAVAHAAAAADEQPLQALATCQDSWFEWKTDATRMARFADYVQTRFVPGERGETFTPKTRTMALGYPVTQVFPQSVGMGVGFSLVIDAAEGLQAVTWRDCRTRVEVERPMRNVFLFVGADPETRWLQDCHVAFDAHGSVLTGVATGASAGGVRAAPLESSIARVFAVGDVRSGSVKRVGGAIGEGAAAVAQIHQYLATTGASG